MNVLAIAGAEGASEEIMAFWGHNSEEYPETHPKVASQQTVSTTLCTNLEEGGIQPWYIVIFLFVIPVEKITKNTTAFGEVSRKAWHA